MSVHDELGGSAFPWMESGVGGQTADGDPGMYLRDWFAGQALVGMIAGGRNIGATTDEDARAAYVYADSMLRERTKVFEATA